MENSSFVSIRHLVALIFLVSVQAATGRAASGSVVSAGISPREGILLGANLQATNVEDVVATVPAGGVLIVSEQHGNQLHYANQKATLAALAKTNRCTVSVGLEFLTWNHQDVISKYFEGRLVEADFLKAVEWGANPFSDYRDQAMFPLSTGGRLLGINAPKALTSAIAKVGIAQLSPEDAAAMPPAFELGTQAYRERFEVVMGTHIPASAMDRYFAAQSTWDDSMAWQSAEFLKQNPSHCLVIIVGDFHAAWDGGLPVRLRARGVTKVTVISQVETRGLTDSELADELGPHPKYGPRADAIWLSESPPETTPSP